MAQCPFCLVSSLFFRPASADLSSFFLFFRFLCGPFSGFGSPPLRSLRYFAGSGGIIITAGAAENLSEKICQKRSVRNRGRIWDNPV